MFAEKRVSALPVVDDNGINIFLVGLLTSLFTGLFETRMILN